MLNQKCPSFCRTPLRGCRFRPISVQTQSVLRYYGSFHGDAPLGKLVEIPDTSVLTGTAFRGKVTGIQKKNDEEPLFSLVSIAC